MKRFQTAFRLALLTAFATYTLIVLGGIVFNTGSSLACPDWPLCFGQVFPVMQGGVLYEHSHRLLGTFVGLCAIGLVAVLWRSDAPARSLRGVALAFLILVVVQGVLGGLIVKMQLPPLVRMAHLGTSMIVLMWILYLCRAAWWRSHFSGLPMPASQPGAHTARNLLLTALLVVYGQMLFGALVRHTGATYALQLGWPGSVVAVDPVAQQAILWPAGRPAEANALHRYLAPLIALLVAAACAQSWKAARAAGRKSLAIWAWAPLLVVLAQIVIGIVMLGTLLNVVARTAHLAGAALLLASIFWLYLCFRLAGGEPAAGPSGEGVRT